MNKVLYLIIALMFVSCGNKKQKEWTDEDRAMIRRGVQIKDSIDLARFMSNYAGLKVAYKDSVFYVTLDSVREGTDIGEIAKDTYRNAVTNNIRLKACVILDGKGEEIARYE